MTARDGKEIGKADRYAVGLDIGATRVCCVVARIADDGSASVVGVGEAASKGLRKGVVVNVDVAVEAVKRAVEEAELMAGIASAVGLVGGRLVVVPASGLN